MRFGVFFYKIKNQLHISRSEISEAVMQLVFLTPSEANSFQKSTSEPAKRGER